MACPVAGGSSEFLDAATGYKDSGLPDSLLEVELLKNNTEFMSFLKQLSQEEPTISLQDLCKELDLEESDGSEH